MKIVLIEKKFNSFNIIDGQKRNPLLSRLTNEQFKTKDNLKIELKAYWSHFR